MMLVDTDTSKEFDNKERCNVGFDEIFTLNLIKDEVDKVKYISESINKLFLFECFDDIDIANPDLIKSEVSKIDSANAIMTELLRALSDLIEVEIYSLKDKNTDESKMI